MEERSFFMIFIFRVFFLLIDLGGFFLLKKRGVWIRRDVEKGEVDVLSFGFV